MATTPTGLTLPAACRACNHGTGLQKGEYCVDAAILDCRVRREIELAENAADVCFYGLRRDVERLRDPAVGSSFRQQREHFELARRQLGERVGFGGRGDEIDAQLSAFALAPALQVRAELRLQARVLERKPGRGSGRPHQPGILE
jgi:hypothetical protein